MIYFNFSLYTIFIFFLFLLLLILLIIQIKRKEILLLRTILFFLIFLLLFKVEFKQKMYGRLTSAFLINNSYSMKFNNRLDKVKNFLSSITNLRNIDIYLFNENIKKIKNINEIKVENKPSKTEDAIRNLLREKCYDMLVLFSDGRDEENSFSYFKKDMFIIPVSFKEDNFKDVSISNINYSKFGFRNIEYHLSLNILSIGYNNIKAKIDLIDIDSKKLLKTKEIFLKEGDNKVDISFVPNFFGKKNFRIELSKFKDEITYENNFVYFNVDFKKEKIRILYICGQPSAEYFHLRNLIKNTASLDLVSFVILRNPESVVIVPDEDLALIPFPTYDIFVKELFNYDLVIFENFSYNKYPISKEYLENIKRFVYSGGGFIMIGGRNSFALGGYKFTPIEEILPVKLSDSEEFIYTDYKPDFIDYNNFLLRVVEDVSLNKKLWQNIPFLGNYQKTEAKENSKVIMSYKNIPIMCYSSYGRGRVFVSLTNTTWRWVLGSLLYKDYDYKNLHSKFWSNVIYWTAGFEDFKDIFIVCDESYNLEDNIEISVLLNLDKDSFSDVNIFVIFPDGSRRNLEIENYINSKYKASFKAVLEGKYKVCALVKKGRQILKDEKEILVKQSQNVISDLRVNLGYLKKIAETYNTELLFIEFLKPDEFVKKLKKYSKEKFINKFQVYNSPIVAIFFIFLFTFEIFIVRYKR